MNGFWRKLRAALDARYEHEIGCLREQHPWLASYQIEPPVSRWYAQHADGTRVGPARTIHALLNQIMADYQSRPLRARPVPYPLPGSEAEELEDRTLWTTWPDGARPPRSAA